MFPGRILALLSCLPLVPSVAEPAWKDISLANAPPVLLSLGGQARGRYEYFENVAWGAGPQDDDGYVMWRLHLSADLRMDDFFRAFVELKDTDITGRKGGFRRLDRSGTDLQQFYLDLVIRDITDGKLTARIGRQELAYGSARLIGVREGPNNRLSFDAGRVMYVSSALKLDAFVASPVEIEPGNFDERNISGEILSGLYATFIEPGLELYALFSTEDDARYQPGLADEERVSLGVRLFGRRNSWDYNLETVYQFGDWGSDDIRAWTIGTDTGYKWTNVAWTPRLALKANVISGDEDPADGRLETFNALYPKGSYFGESALIGPANLFNFHPYLELSPHGDVDLLIEAIGFWRYSTDDGIYNPGRALIRSGAGSDKRFLGTQWNLQVEWRATPQVTLRLDYNFFDASEFWSETGSGNDVQYIGAQARLTF